jgi:predicted DNA binding CopG/RHH family protein
MKKRLINNVKDIPSFDTEAEEQVFWETHRLNANLFSKANNKDLLELPLQRTEQGKSKPISLRLERDLDKRLRALAEQKGTSYQTLLKEFVLERVYEEEKRLGIL